MALCVCLRCSAGFRPAAPVRERLFRVSDTSRAAFIRQSGGEKVSSRPRRDLAALVAARQRDPQDQTPSEASKPLWRTACRTNSRRLGCPACPWTCPPLPDGLGTRVVPKAYLPTPATEPQHGWVFSRVAYVYVPATAGGANRLLCRLHYTQDGDADLAGRMGGLLALAHRTLVERTGQEAANGTRRSTSGCAARGSPAASSGAPTSTFTSWTPRAVPSSGSARSYTSMAIWPCRPSAGIRPPSTGRTATTANASSRAGSRGRRAGRTLVAQVWGDFSGWPNFQRLLIAPALALYKKSGPSPERWRRGPTRLGMRYLIGQILTFDDKYGGAAARGSLHAPAPVPGGEGGGLRDGHRGDRAPDRRGDGS